MNVSLGRIGVRIGLCCCLLGAVAPREAHAQVSGLFQSEPGTFAEYKYQASGIQTVMLPIDLTLIFSNDNSTSMVTATILKPIIGAHADATPIYPIAGYFPMRVTGTSQNGRDFYGDLLGSQYLFDWQIEPASPGELQLNGRVYWAGGRIELTTIDNLQLTPAVAGDYNRDGAVDAADYIVWRNNVGTANPLPNDPIGGTIGLAHFDQWRVHFGQSAGSSSGAGVNGGLPEPTTFVLIVIATAGWCIWRSRT